MNISLCRLGNLITTHSKTRPLNFETRKCRELRRPSLLRYSLPHFSFRQDPSILRGTAPSHTQIFTFSSFIDISPLIANGQQSRLCNSFIARPINILGTSETFLSGERKIDLFSLELGLGIGIISLFSGTDEEYWSHY